MPKLNCSVESCKYQKENLCSARAINVVDINAIESDETDCRTYTYADSAITSSTHHATEDIDITCDVVNCLHYNNHKCNAKIVEINDYNATSTEETECSSFIIK